MRQFFDNTRLQLIQQFVNAILKNAHDKKTKLIVTTQIMLLKQFIPVPMLQIIIIIHHPIYTLNPNSIIT